MQLLSVKDIAKMLGCCDRTVYRLKVAEKLPGCVKVGGMLRWRADIVESWIDRGCPEGDKENGFDETLQGGGEDSRSARVPW